LENPPNVPEGVNIINVIWGENMKRGKEKGGKCKRKRKKEERKPKREDGM
jgi:hypothetical protein